MNFKLCAFADEAGKSLTEQIAALMDNSIRLLEIRNVDGENIAEISESKAYQIKSALDTNGIKVFSVGSPLGKVKITDNFEQHKKTFLHILKLCKIFECKRVRIFSFFTDKHDKYRSEVIARLAEMVRIAGENDINLYHENEKNIYGDTAERVIDLAKSVPGLKFIYDPANYVQVGQDIDAALNTVFDFSEYFHIKDAIKKTGEVVPAGEGDGKIEKLLRLIDKEAVLTIEPHLAIFDGYGKIDVNEMKNKYYFKSNREAFDCAVTALKNLIKKCGKEVK